METLEASAHPVPPMSDTTRALVEQAAAKMGVSPLAKHLSVADAVVAAWITGHASIPSHKLALLVELLEKLE